MTKEQFMEWAAAVVVQVTTGQRESEEFARMVEAHDKGAAASLRKMNKIADDLAAHLTETLSAGDPK